MHGLPDSDIDFSFRKLFLPLTNTKAIAWIILIGIIVYANMLFNGFVWDDKIAILANPDFTSTANFIKINLFNLAGQYRPLAFLYFYLAHALFNEISFFYHILQLFLQIVNTALLFIFLKKFFSKNISFILSIIFLIHPIQVESVSYISASENLLFFLFGMIALFASYDDRISVKKLLVVTVTLLFAFLTKETGFLFLFLVLLYRFLFKRKHNFYFLASGFIAVCLYCFIRFLIGGVYLTTLGWLIPIERLSLIDRLINIPEIIFYYLKTLFFPWKLVIDQIWIVQNINFYTFYLPLIFDLLFFIALVILGIYLKSNTKKFRVYLFFLLWFLAGMLLHLQILPLDLTVADKWLYLPFVGLLGVIGIFAEEIKLVQKKAVIIAYTIIIVVIVVLSVRTMIRNTNWINATTLYEHDSKISTNFDLENNLGGEFESKHDYIEAIRYYKKSVELFPYETNLYNLGYTYQEIGNIQEAKNYYFKSLQAQNYYPSGHTHYLNLYIQLGILLLYHDDPKTAQKELKSALHDYPNSWALWALLAAAEYQLHNQDEALADAEKARYILPSEQNNTLYMDILNKRLHIP